MSKTIAMIDANHMIDRRIILEAELLISQGFNVFLCCKEERKKTSYSNDLEYIIPIYRFEEMDVAWKTFYDSFEFYSRYLPHKIATLLVCFLHPKAGRLRLDESAIHSNLKNILLLTHKIIFPFVKTTSQEDFSYWEKKVLDFILEKKPDVIHVHDLPALKLGVELKSKLNIPLVYDAHEIYPFQPGYDDITREKLYQAEKNMINDSDMVVVINEDQAQFMMGEYGEFKYSVLTNATSYPRNYSKDKKYNLIREKLNLDSSTKLILFQGGVNRLRKIDLLIEAISLTAENVHLVLMTWGLEVVEFQELAVRLGVSSRVHFLDPVPWEEVIFWAASADIGFLPYQALDLNTKISSPNKMYEFILSHTPMIASKDLLNVKRVFESQGVGLLWDLRRSKDYADAIKKMLSDQELYQKYKENLKKCSDKFTWEVLSSDFKLKYKELVN